MENPPILSVIMSVYNAEIYLKDSINSILNQTFADFEFIIIDDCSTDKSLEILEEYSKFDSRIVLIHKEINKGTKGFIENLNIGLEKARGKYVARMDADDISDLNRFEKQINFLENNTDVFIVGSYLNFIDENGNKINEKKAPIVDQDIKKKMYKNIALYHPVIMFRNSNIRYREKMYGCEDYDLFFRLILDGKKMANLNEFLLDYRILKNSISRKDNKFTKWVFVEMTRKFYKESLKNGNDSYSEFEPEELKNILNPSFKNKLKELKIAIITAIKFQKKDEYNNLINKLKFFYPEQSILKYRFKMFLYSIIKR